MDTQIVNRDRSIFFPRLNFQSENQIGRPAEEGNSYGDDGKVKTRLLSMWHNMKYGMKLKTNFSKESPVWLLGKCYRRIESPSSEVLTELGTDVAAFQSQSELNISGDSSTSNNEQDEGLEGFRKDFVSRLWMTYRREFPILNGSNYSSDCGWGCMLRTGQMLIGQALVCHFLGRDWRWDPEQSPKSRSSFVDEVNHRKIIKWFGDKPSRNSPFSIHTLVTLGEASGKKAGDWYGPGFVAHLFKEAMKLACKDNYEFDSLAVCVSQDCTVYMEDVIEECTDKNGKWKSLILLIPVRLGAEKFNAIYAPCLTTLFSLKQCIGIIGGRPKHSLYFVGYQDDKLIHLDPHYCQEVVDVWASDFSLNSFHCRSPRKIHISKMDPSCCIGFYCKTREEFFNLIETVQPLVIPPRSENSSEYPMFIFCEGHSRDARISPKKRMPSSAQPPEFRIEECAACEPDDLETEPFEIL